MARSGPLPTLDEYVLARGPELLRTAWLLTGDSERARELVQGALATLWRKPSRSPRWGEGTLDAAARRAVVRQYLRRSGHSASRSGSDGPEGLDASARGDPTTGWSGGSGAHDDEVARLRRDVLEGLGGLTRLQRAVVVLRCDEGLDDAQVAEVLGRGVGTVRTERARALASMGHVRALEGRGDSPGDVYDLDDLDAQHDPDDVAERLRAALATIAPEAVAGGAFAGRYRTDEEDLAEGTRRYAARARRTRAVAVVGGVVAIVALGSLAGFAVQRDRSASLAQKPPPLTCATLPPERGTPRAGGKALSTRARAALICADRSDRSIWPGSLPPDEPISDPSGLDYLVLAPPVDRDARCAPLPVGPAFTITVQGKDGRSLTYDNVDLACNGWLALDRYFIALGEQQAAESFDPSVDPFPACPSALGQRLKPRHDGAPGVPQGTVFTAGAACLHQSPDPTRVPVFQRPKRSVLGDTELTALTREAATHGSGPTSAACDDSVPAGPVVVVRAMTADGTLIELTGSRGCGRELLVNWSPGDYWTLTRATADSVTADFGGFPR